MDNFNKLMALAQDLQTATLPTNTYTETDKGFDVSYLPDQQSTYEMGMELLPIGQDETALIIEGQPMRILNGDWQEQYLKCKDADEAIDVFEANKVEHLNPYSEDK